MTMWALFYDGKRVSKPHSTRDAAIIEAYELNAVVAERGKLFLVDGCEIREVAASTATRHAPGFLLASSPCAPEA